MSTYNTTIEWARESRVRTLAQLETTSTNSEAKEHLDTLGHRALVIADHQTAGRGRGQHTWSDSSGQALLSSWIFQLDKSPQPIMSALIGLALYEAAEKTWPKIGWALRAPNDLHIVTQTNPDDAEQVRKIAGILIEMVTGLDKTTPSKVSMIVGLGMNVSGAPTGTRPYSATSLSNELGLLGLLFSDADWRLFLTAWLENCESQLGPGQKSELNREARSNLVQALKKHPEYREIEDVEANGSISFKNGRKVLWSDL